MSLKLSHLTSRLAEDWVVQNKITVMKSLYKNPVKNSRETLKHQSSEHC